MSSDFTFFLQYNAPVVGIRTEPHTNYSSLRIDDYSWQLTLLLTEPELPLRIALLESLIESLEQVHPINDIKRPRKNSTILPSSFATIPVLSTQLVTDSKPDTWSITDFLRIKTISTTLQQEAVKQMQNMQARLTATQYRMENAK